MNNDTKHTPTPWTTAPIEDAYVGTPAFTATVTSPFGSVWVCTLFSEHHEVLGRERDLIVRACNSHAALVDLARAIDTAYGNKVLPSHTEKHLLDGARAALKLAGE